MSIGAYYQRVAEAQAPVEIAPIARWHLLPAYLDALAERVRDELAAIGAQPEVVSGVESLTATERRAAEMSSAGADVRAIAQAMFLTPRAVEQHLAAAHRKLGVRSREELAAVLPSAVS